MFEAHKNDIDKGGYPYVFHPFYLATQMDDEYSTCVALLHDVIEDHGDLYSFDSLTEAGFPVCVIDALKSLTHNSNSKRYIIGTCKKEKNIENIVLEKLRFSGALFFFLRLIK